MVGDTDKAGDGNSFMCVRKLNLARVESNFPWLSNSCVQTWILLNVSDCVNAAELGRFEDENLLAPNFIEVVFYRSKWYSMDNRRLW